MAKKLIRKLLRRAKPASSDPVPVSTSGQLPLDTAGPERVPELRMDGGETAPARERTLAEYLGDAVELRNAGRFDQADALLAEAIERFPEEPRPRFEWAILPHFRLDWAEAARRSELVREQFPDAAATHALGAIVLRELGRYDDAERLLAAARERFPDDLRIAAESAWLATHKQNWAEALRRWGGVRKNFPDWPGGYTGTAMIYRELTWFDEAEVTLEDAAERFHADTDLFVEYARFEQARGNASAAAERWQAVRDRFPDERAGYEEGAAVLRELGRDEEAEALMVEAAERFSTPAVPAAGKIDTALVGQDVTPGASVQSAVGDKPEVSEEASATADTPPSPMPEDPSTLCRAARALLAGGDPERAEALLAAAAQRFSDNVEIAIALAEAAEQRQDWLAAAERWDRVLQISLDEIIAYLGLAAALRQLERTEDAELVLSAAMERFPDDRRPAIEYAWLAHNRCDWEKAARRWDAVRALFPDERAGYEEGASVLRELDRDEEAETLLADAAKQIPILAPPTLPPRQDPTPNAPKPASKTEARTSATVPAEATIKDPESSPATGQRPLQEYVAAATVARDAARYSEAESLLSEAIERYPAEPRAWIEWSVVAHSRRDWTEAERRWGTVRTKFPDDAIAYVLGGIALRELSRYEDAESLLAQAIGRFPENPGAANEYAWLASIQRHWPAALDRWEQVRVRFPDQSAGYVQSVNALRELGRLDEADKLALEATKRFPGEARPYIEWGLISHQRREWTEAASRWTKVREHFPDEPTAYVLGAIAFREEKRFGEAETLIDKGSDRFPTQAGFSIEHARLAEALQDWPVAVERWRAVRAKTPDLVEGYLGAGHALVQQGSLAEAEEILQEGIRRIPSNPMLFALFASIASTRNDWQAAVARWTDAQQRFPASRDFAARLFEARLRLCEVDPAAVASMERMPPDGGQAAGEMYHIMMAFESLGHGCEFGVVQREFGAEPLSLLRWGAISPEDLIAALRSGFPGVGAPENTELTLRPNGQHTEYWVADRRFGMEMHTFIGQKQISFERMFAQSCRRMEFLSRKLLEDLEKYEKIFVYKLDHRDLFDDEIFGLHDALRQYGEAVLLCVRKENQTKRNGLVEVIRPGLMVAYIDRFAEPQPDGRLTVPMGSWSEICRTAYALWKSGASEHPASEVADAVAPSDPSSSDEPEARLNGQTTDLASDRDSAVEQAWAVLRQGDWREALERWHSVRERFPDADTRHGVSIALSRFIETPPSEDTELEKAKRAGTPGHLDTGRARLLFVGNCHAEALCHTLRRCNSMLGFRAIDHLPSYEVMDETGRERISNADIIVEQVQDFDPQIGDLELKAGQRRYSMPLVMGGFLWPFAGQPHPKVSTVIPLLPYGAQYGDSFLNGLIEKGAGPEQAVEVYLSVDAATVAHADRRFELAMALQERIDDKTGWDTADFIERNLSHEHLFMSHGHPNYPLLTYLMEGVCQRIGLEDAQIDYVLERISSYPCTGSEIPIHPSICKHFGLKFIKRQHRYRYFPEGKLTFEQYVNSYMTREWSLAFDKAALLSRDGDLGGAVAEALVGTEEAPRSSIGWQLLGSLLAANGSLDEAMRALRRAAELDPYDPRPGRDTAALLLRLHREEEAIETYLRAIQLEPKDAKTWTGLAQARIQQGRYPEALDAAEQAWTLNGWLPRGQRLLDECRQRAESFELVTV